jgi:hypothetical protein
VLPPLLMLCNPLMRPSTAPQQNPYQSLLSPHNSSIPHTNTMRNPQAHSSVSSLNHILQHLHNNPSPT